MAFPVVSHARIAINDSTPTLITPSNDDIKTNCTLQVQNLGEYAIYIGGEELSLISYGVSIVPGGAVTIDELPPKGEMYAMSSVGDSYVAVLRIVR